MLRMCDGCKDVLDTDKMGHPLAQHGASLAPFRANGAHPSDTSQRTHFIAIPFVLLDSASSVITCLDSHKV